MRIIEQRTNHLKNPIGYMMNKIFFSWKVTDSNDKYTKYYSVKVAYDYNMKNIVYESGLIYESGKNSLAADFVPKPCTRYYWVVELCTERNKIVKSDVAYFETGLQKLQWTGKWIRTDDELEFMPCIYKNFEIEQKVIEARLYICGLGLYEAYINNQKAGEEYLMPGYHSYDSFVEYQTFDITNIIGKGNNEIKVILGEGWYKGRFGFDGNYRNLYGNHKKLIAEIHLQFENGESKIIGTDDSWNARESEIGSNSIYDGEIIDFTRKQKYIQVIEDVENTLILRERNNMPICITEQFYPVSIQKTNDKEFLIDFGEAITGWVELNGDFQRNQKILIQYAEILQENKFYRDNLRTAKSEFEVVFSGEENEVRPHFTYYGFRYIQVQGLDSIQNIKFTASRIMSDIDRTGYICTSNQKVNQLFENTVRSQKCNFLDIPTDCPQRDERMGWTGDVSVFVDTACFHMESSRVFWHFADCIRTEQKKLNGAVPFFAPLPKVAKEENTNPFYITAGAAVWGDVASIMPWNIYEHYGDITQLSEMYPMMKDWADYLIDRAAKNTVPYLWQNDSQLGDWLALDNGNINNPIGKTDQNMIASAFFYNTVRICEMAAQELENHKDFEYYKELAKKIKKQFIEFYFNDENELKTEKTQTAYALILYMGLYNENGKDKLILELKTQLDANRRFLNTGFVGTPILCKVLSESGLNEYAYSLLLNEQYPGWLFEVNCGATTIWERWNSLDTEGLISSTGMNSLNHYSYGSIAAWLYRYMCGFMPSMNKETKMVIKPYTDSRIKSACGKWNSPYGIYSSKWEYENDKIKFEFEIPFNANAKVILPDGREEMLMAGKYMFYTKGR